MLVEMKIIAYLYMRLACVVLIDHELSGSTTQQKLCTFIPVTSHTFLMHINQTL